MQQGAKYWKVRTSVWRPCFTSQAPLQASQIRRESQGLNQGQHHNLDRHQRWSQIPSKRFRPQRQNHRSWGARAMMKVNGWRSFERNFWRCVSTIWGLHYSPYESLPPMPASQCCFCLSHIIHPSTARLYFKECPHFPLLWPPQWGLAPLNETFTILRLCSSMCDGWQKSS